MPLPCPKCSIPMEERPVVSGNAQRDLNVCPRCGGLWLDEGDLATYCPTVADLPARRQEVALVGERGGGIASCPRCGGQPLEFPVVGVRVDFCDACGGVWLDGDEIHEAPADSVSGPSVAAAHPYRQAAVESIGVDEVRCEQCNEAVPFKASFMWERGLICQPCYAAKLQRAADRRATESAPKILDKLIARLLGLGQSG